MNIEAKRSSELPGDRADLDAGVAARHCGRTALRFAAWVGLALLLLSAAILAAWVAWGEPMRHAVIEIDGDRLDLAALQGRHWLVAFLGVFAALLAALFVVPLVVMLGVLLPLLIVGLVCAVGLAVLTAVLLLLLSPLILLALGVRRVARRRAAPVSGIAP